MTCQLSILPVAQHGGKVCHGVDILATLLQDVVARLLLLRLVAVALPLEPVGRTQHCTVRVNPARLLSLTIIVGTHIRMSPVLLAGNVIPPAGLPVVALVVVHHFKAILLLISVRLSTWEVDKGPGLVVEPGPGSLRGRVRSAHKKCGTVFDSGEAEDEVLLLFA